MNTGYRARWISKKQADAVRRAGRLGQAFLLDTYNGYVIVEPANSKLGDGPVLSLTEAEYELQPAWYTGPKAKLREARQKLGLAAETLATAGV